MKYSSWQYGVNRVAIVFCFFFVVFVPCILTYPTIVQGYLKPTCLTKNESIKIAVDITSRYRSSLISVTNKFFDSLQGVKDGDILRKIFMTCSGNSLHVTSKFGWDKAKIVFVGNNTDHVMNKHTNLPSELTAIEENVVKSIRKRIVEIGSNVSDEYSKSIVAVESDGAFYIVGVYLFNDCELDQDPKVLNGCIGCHNNILNFDKRQEFIADNDKESDIKFTDIFINKVDLRGVVLFKIKMKGENEGV